ncbi:MAG: carbohydrate ABC transporter permease, partial [Eisenbergiella sp.]
MEKQTDFAKIEKNARRRRQAGKVLTYTGLTIWALIVLFPFYWMVLTSVKSYGSYNAERVPGFFTLSPTLENYVSAFTAVPLGRYLLNTLLFTVITTAVMVVVSTLAAYAFARLEWKGKNLVFTLFLSMMMIPAELVV